MGPAHLCDRLSLPVPDIPDHDLRGANTRTES